MNDSEPMMYVGAWNLLLDKTRTREGLVSPQAERVDRHISALGRTGIAFDALCLMEAEEVDGVSHGAMIATALGYGEGEWRQHNRKREHIGICGNQIGDVEFVELGFNKKAVITEIAGVAIAGVHLKRERVGPKRAAQTEVLLNRLSDYHRAIVMGDLNALPFEKAPRLLRGAGFRSAFTLAGQRRPGSWPSAGYRDVMLPPWQRRILPVVNYDDIYVRGLEVGDAGSFEGESDHLGVWASLILDHN